jgi:hypothetical protein
MSASLSPPMSTMFSLYRREEVTVPSLPRELTKTATPALVCPEIPAMKAAVGRPARMVLILCYTGVRVRCFV